MSLASKREKIMEIRRIAKIILYLPFANKNARNVSAVCPEKYNPAVNVELVKTGLFPVIGLPSGVKTIKIALTKYNIPNMNRKYGISLLLFIST
jgi:hypothetical protein